jgi:hypothetical protein
MWSCVAFLSIFLHIIAQAGLFWGEKFAKYKMCVLIFSTTFVCNIFHPKGTAKLEPEPPDHNTTVWTDFRQNGKNKPLYCLWW